MMRESEIEKSVTRFAQSQGWLALKFTSPNNNGVPDRVFIRGGKVVFVEFKQSGKKPTPLQDYVHNKIREKGGTVHVIDNVDGGRWLLG